MAELQFGETDEERLATLCLVVRGLWTDIHGNGQPGLKTRAEQFMSEHNGAQAEQIRQHESNSRKLNIIMAICAIATLLVLAIGLEYTAEAAHHAEKDPAKIFHSHNYEPVLSLNKKPPQDAQIYKVR